jgi:hypothetical protein
MFALFLSLLTCPSLILQMVSALDMFIKPKTHFFLLFKMKHIMVLHTIQNVLSSCYIHFLPLLMIFPSLACYSKVQLPSFDLWYFMFSFLECI